MNVQFTMNVQFSVTPQLRRISQLGPEILAQAKKLTAPEQTEDTVSPEFQAMLEEMGLESVEDIPVADFSNVYTPSAKSEEFSPAVKMGMEYGRICFDFTNAGDYTELTAAEDFTGMTAVEIYKSIYEKYQHCYGEDFYSYSYVKYPEPSADYDHYGSVLRKFGAEVRAACGTDYAGTEKLRRQALYGDMSSAEVRQSIIGKYDLSDGMSVRELYQISGEMSAVGVDGGLGGSLDLLWASPLTASGYTDFALREQMLDTNVTDSIFDQLELLYRNRLSVGGQVDGDYLSALSRLRQSGGQAADLSGAVIPDEQAAYYREKYGYTYDEDTVYKLYDELAEDGLTDMNYTAYASGYTRVMPLTGLKCRGCFTAGGRDVYGLGRYCTDNSIEFVSGRIFVKDISRTDENAYKTEWDAFSAEYDREIVTWQDKLRESIDFEKYLKENSPGGSTPVQEHFDNVIAGLENTLSVIEKIFGTEEELP